MSIIRTCCNKELNATCIYGCVTKYCTNEEEVCYRPLDGGCSGYVNREVFSKQYTSYNALYEDKMIKC